MITVYNIKMASVLNAEMKHNKLQLINVIVLILIIIIYKIVQMIIYHFSNILISNKAHVVEKYMVVINKHNMKFVTNAAQGGFYQLVNYRN